MYAQHCIVYLKAINNIYFSLDYRNYYGDCTTVYNIKVSIILTCLCQRNNYYQAMLQRYNEDIESVINITSQRALCLQSMQFEAKENGTYNIIVFHENKEYGIVGTDVFFAKEFTIAIITKTIITTDFTEVKTSAVTPKVLSKLNISKSVILSIFM